MLHVFCNGDLFSWQKMTSPLKQVAKLYNILASVKLKMGICCEVITGKAGSNALVNMIKTCNCVFYFFCQNEPYKVKPRQIINFHFYKQNIFTVQESLCESGK
jgi:hypothetical protein